MRPTEPIRREVEELKPQLHRREQWHPSAVAIWAIFLGVTVLIVIAFFAGYIPLQKRKALIASEAAEQEQALPRAEVIEVGKSSRQGAELELPANIQAITEAPILSRADGYVLHRLADIGDRVKAGQTLAEIEAPETDQQIAQAKAALQQAQAALEQAQANFEQGKSNVELARVTAQRWGQLAAQGVVSKQDDDQKQAQYQALVAGQQAFDKAIAAQRSNVVAMQANLARLNEVQGYRLVKAPFDGVITLRNVDVGALVNTGSTLLFRIAQTGTLRAMVNVPQSNASFVRVGETARLSVTNLPGRSFAGKVARTANALDPTSRTLLVELDVPNADGALMPGMYAQMELSGAAAAATLTIPGEALLVRADGTRVAVVQPDHSIHLQKVEVGRDYGDRVEILNGLHAGDLIIPNPGDLAREGVKVNPVK